MEKSSGCFSFLKLLKDEDFSKEIQIPDSFVKKYSKELSRSYILLDTQAELSWTVKIRCRETHRNYYMCEGEWSFFVKFYDLKYGDYLLFSLIDDNVFKVVPYGADCCPKFSSDRRRNQDFHHSISDDDGDGDNEEEEEDDRLIHKRRRSAVDSRTNQSQNNNNNNNKKKKIKVEVGTAHSKKSQDFKKSNVVDSCPLGSSRRSKSGSRGPGATKDLNAKEPFFIVTISKHNRRYMTIPKAFAEKTKIVEEENVTLRSKDNREWTVGIENTKDGRVNLKYAWRDFYKGYGLEEGDNCKFTHLIMNHHKGSEIISTLLVEVN